MMPVRPLPARMRAPTAAPVMPSNAISNSNTSGGSATFKQRCSASATDPVCQTTVASGHRRAAYRLIASAAIASLSSTATLIGSLMAFIVPLRPVCRYRCHAGA